MEFIVPREFTAEEKILIKARIIDVSQILKKWGEKLDANIADVKNAFLTGKVLVDSEEWHTDQKVLTKFQKQTDPIFGEPIEFAILRSFANACSKYARKACLRVSAQSRVHDSDSYEDFFQEAVRSVLHSMYYYAKEDIELSTFIINAISNSINRAIRYNYCITSPISVEDNKTKIKFFELVRNNPGLTQNELIEKAKKDGVITSEFKLSQLLNNHVVREKDDTKSILSFIPCRSNFEEEMECVDTVSLFEKVLSPEGQQILSLTFKEVEILKFGISLKFERGWQTICSKESNISRARVGQVFDSAIKKIRPYFEKMCG